MTHVFLYLFSFGCLGTGGYVIVANIHGPVHILLVGAGLIAASALFAIPANAKTAIEAVAPYLPWHRP